MTRLEGCWTFGEHGDEVTVILDAEVDVGRLGAWMGRVADQFTDRHLQKVKTAFSARIAALAGRTADTGRHRALCLRLQRGGRLAGLGGLTAWGRGAGAGARGCGGR